MEPHRSGLTELLYSNYHLLGTDYENLFKPNAQLSFNQSWQLTKQHSPKKPSDRLIELTALAKQIILTPDADQIPRVASFVKRFNEEWTACQEKVKGKFSNRADDRATIPFSSKQYPYSWLSNFFSTLVSKGSRIFYSAEHAYQAEKFPAASITFKEIAEGIDPLVAKQRAERETNTPSEESRLQFMRDIAYRKFSQNVRLNELLKSSKGKLIEQTNSAFWGAGPDNTGLNHLGRILEDLRQHLMLNLIMKPNPELVQQ